MNNPHAQSKEFPLAFPYNSIHSEQLELQGKAPFIVVGMLTKNFSQTAERLTQSCKQHKLPYVLYEVPAVHRSICQNGVQDLRFTKPNFINFLLESHNSPILYIDVDCYFEEKPVAISKLVKDNYDFAIYNWLADEHTECYVPVELKCIRGNEEKIFTDRFYKYTHSVDYFTNKQLICSGAVQFYNNTEGARALLRKWHENIVEFNKAADDECLDYTFNNYFLDNKTLKAGWLKKGYMRYAWWIYERPIINHPKIPYMGDKFLPIPGTDGKKRFYPERSRQKPVKYHFPRDCVIDTEKKLLMRLDRGQLTPWKPVTRKLWL